MKNIIIILFLLMGVVNAQIPLKTYKAWLDSAWLDDDGTFTEIRTLWNADISDTTDQTYIDLRGEISDSIETTLNNDLTVGGEATFQDKVYFEDNVYLSGTLNYVYSFLIPTFLLVDSLAVFSDSVEFEDRVIMDDALEVTGAATFSDDVNMGGGTFYQDFLGVNLYSVNGLLNVDSLAGFNDSVVVDGNVRIIGRLDLDSLKIGGNGSVIDSVKIVVDTLKFYVNGNAYNAVIGD